MIVLTLIADLFKTVTFTLADPRGGARDAPPPRGSKLFHFHAVFGKNVKNNSNFGSWRPPGENPGSATVLLYPFCVTSKCVSVKKLELKNFLHQPIERLKLSFLHFTTIHSILFVRKTDGRLVLWLVSNFSCFCSILVCYVFKPQCH